MKSKQPRLNFLKVDGDYEGSQENAALQTRTQLKKAAKLNLFTVGYHPLCLPSRLRLHARGRCPGQVGEIWLEMM